MKTNDAGERLCDQHDCELIATHTLVWTKPRCYCLAHTEMAIRVAEAMGFPTPKATLRPMTVEEMLPEGDES